METVQSADLLDAENVQFEIITNHGIIVNKGQVRNTDNHYSIPVNKVVAGSYWLIVRTKNNYFVKKIIVV